MTTRPPSAIALALALSFFAVLVTWSGSAASQPYQTEQYASSRVDAGGFVVESEVDTDSNGYASSMALYPPSPTPFQARTAARTGSTEIAVNSRIFDDAYSNQGFDSVSSQAQFVFEVPSALVPRGASFDFFLPPAEIEIVSNAEVRNNTLRASLVAAVRVCVDKSACSFFSDTRFELNASMDGSHADLSWGASATGDANLDLTALRNPVLSDNFGPGGSNFIRTSNLTFPSFTGHIDVGLVPVASVLRVEYIMQTRVEGQLLFNSAFAAINDPFMLDTDAVQQGAPFTSVVVAAVPEPASASMLAAGLFGLGFWRWRNRRRGQG